METKGLDDNFVQAQDDLNLLILHTFKGMFSLDVAYMFVLFLYFEASLLVELQSEKAYLQTCAQRRHVKGTGYTKPWGYKTISMLNSAKHENSPANKSQFANNCKFFLAKHI